MIVIHVLQSPDPSSKEPLLLIFMSSWGRDVLMASKTWVVDGTFKSCPHPFGQVFFFIIFVVVESDSLLLFHLQIYILYGRMDSGKSVPVCWSLLPGKGAEVYNQYWTVIHQVRSYINTYLFT